MSLPVEHPTRATRPDGCTLADSDPPLGFYAAHWRRMMGPASCALCQRARDVHLPRTGGRGRPLIPPFVSDGCHGGSNENKTDWNCVAFLCLSTLALAQVKTETEPNNSRAQAQGIRIGDSIEGAFQAAGDNDWFKLVVDKPGKNEIQIDLSTVPTLLAHFVIQDKDGKEIWTGNQSRVGETESVSRFVVTEGVYFFRIDGRDQNPTDKYTLSTRLLGPWRENTEAEPNDDITRANELRLDVPMTGRVNRDLNIDCYVVTIPEPGREILLFQISGIPGDVSDMELLDAKGKKVGETVRGEPGSGSEIVRMRVKPGTYYLRVSPPRTKKVGSEYTLYAGKPPKPPASPAEVQQTLVKALGWLAKKQGKDGSWTGTRGPTGFTGLSLMAFIGGKCVPQDYATNVKRAVEYL
ncbi:MAG: PPC domain-containing protein, partial [Candidatus Atribacteria bacterium]|nr:PPC domain-containing protein [Candidatus Atribacteria bacterium]